MTLIALSASYGSGGSQIGPALAERLGVPFVDRAVALQVAERLDVSVDDAIAHEEPAHVPSFLQRLLSGFAAADVSTPAPLAAEGPSPEDFHAAARDVLQAQAQTGRGVILGRGAVAALRADPRVLRVRLTGPPERRIEQAMRIGRVDRDTAEQALKRLDRAHAEYLRDFYGLDIDDPGLYHMQLDATALGPEFCVDVIARAAEELRSAAGAAG